MPAGYKERPRLQGYAKKGGRQATSGKSRSARRDENANYQYTKRMWGNPAPTEQTFRGTESFSYKQEEGWRAGTVVVGFQWVSTVCLWGRGGENEGTDRPLGIMESQGVPRPETG